jgi:hypothetical protein
MICLDQAIKAYYDHNMMAVTVHIKFRDETEETKLLRGSQVFGLGFQS